MNVRLFLLAKLLACKDNANDFRAGHLYANILGYFRSLTGPEGWPIPARDRCG